MPHIDKIPFILYKNAFSPPFSLSFWLFISLSAHDCVQSGWFTLSGSAC